jgi:predicted metalloprotease with PDZ domain
VGAGIFFSFTIRRADDQSLGLKVERSADARGLVVREICKNGGAIEAWNMQCVGPAAAKAVQPGDKIVCVNGVSCCDGMLGEIQAKYLLKLLVVRGASDYAPGVEVATDGEYATEGVSERRCAANPETVGTAVSGPCMIDASQGWWTLPSEYF